ncbi:unnamed protein product [Paramecium octaurelia]|uniref:RRM domain-containing protein n=1 Tax=Paramecium octaurelia TaxID=43137 RepID=A0A8S1WVU3_PAROT|nr:unnamed protein product [Paramecium octaurelia]
MSEPKKKLWIGNLAYKVQKDDLEELFKQYGQITEIKVLDKGPHVYAFVEFEKVEKAIEAFNSLQGRELKGQAMKIEYASGRKRSTNDRDKERGRGGNDKYRKRDSNYKRRSRSRSVDRHKKKPKSHKRHSSSSESSRRDKQYNKQKQPARSPSDDLSN